MLSSIPSKRKLFSPWLLGGHVPQLLLTTYKLYNKQNKYCELEPIDDKNWNLKTHTFGLCLHLFLHQKIGL